MTLLRAKAEGAWEFGPVETHRHSMADLRQLLRAMRGGADELGWACTRCGWTGPDYEPHFLATRHPGYTRVGRA